MLSSLLGKVLDVQRWVQRRLNISWPAPSQATIETVRKNGLLGFVCFGGPPVHFQIFHHRFVDKYHWIEEPMFQELFALVQSLSGPGSTKMLYCINLLRNGIPSAVLAFLVWSLPGAIGMYALSLGISSVGDTLPDPAYALLSGLNSATVGIIALAAVQLSQKAITDKLTRVLVFLGGTAGMLYNALWYFPLLIFLAGPVTIMWDFRWLHVLFSKLSSRSRPSSRPDADRDIEPTDEDQEVAAPEPDTRTVSADGTAERRIPEERQFNISWKSGAMLIACFLATFVAVMVVRGVVKNRPVLFNLFANLYLAGTIIFGGGPVVIPLLRQYIVAEGWVSARDFLLGLAIIQAFPGPNFNFAVYLGSLTAIKAHKASIAGAVVAYVGIFAPGMILVHGTLGLWSALRSRRWVKAGLRGINAAAVGLIYTAVYRLWQIGYIDQDFTSGASLSRDPWWLVVAATSYVGCCWFSVRVPLAILVGGTMGLVRYGATID